MELTYQPFRDHDLERSAELAVDAWPIARLIAEDEAVHMVLSAIKSFMIMS